MECRTGNLEISKQCIMVKRIREIATALRQDGSTERWQQLPLFLDLFMSLFPLRACISSSFFSFWADFMHKVSTFSCWICEGKVAVCSSSFPTAPMSPVCCVTESRMERQTSGRDTYYIIVDMLQMKVMNIITKQTAGYPVALTTFSSLSHFSSSRLLKRTGLNLP